MELKIFEYDLLYLRISIDLNSYMYYNINFLNMFIFYMNVNNNR